MEINVDSADGDKMRVYAAQGAGRQKSVD